MVKGMAKVTVTVIVTVRVIVLGTVIVTVTFKVVVSVTVMVTVTLKVEFQQQPNQHEKLLSRKHTLTSYTIVTTMVTNVIIAVVIVIAIIKAIVIVIATTIIVFTDTDYTLSHTKPFEPNFATIISKMRGLFSYNEYNVVIVS